MKNLSVIIILFTTLIWGVSLFAQEEEALTAYRIPKIAILDVMSESFNDSETNIFTDILRTEIFQLRQFTIVERGMIQQILQNNQISLHELNNDSQLLEVGRYLSVDKLLICKIESLADSIVINLRMIDVDTSMLDYTENVFVSDKNQIFQALSDLVLQFRLYYQSNNENLTLEKKREIITQNWMIMDADESDLLYLLENNIEPTQFIELRQFDITFTVKDFIAIQKNGWDRDVIKEFFREGIRYEEIQRALQLGIGDLKNYQSSFKPRDLTFSEYLDAYEHNIVSSREYQEYKKGYEKDYLILGLGGVADSLPILNASFSFFVIKAGWEHYISDFQRDFYKYSIEMGSNFFMGYLPSPYFQVNYYLGQHPFYAKASLGGVAEVLVGGHYGAYACLGLELGGTIDFSVMATFAGTQPIISYADFETKRGDPDYGEILFPYIGVFLNYKLSNFVNLW